MTAMQRFRERSFRGGESTVGGTRGPRSGPRQIGAPTSPRGTVTLFLGGDVMPGRGVDEIRVAATDL